MEFKLGKRKMFAVTGRKKKNPNMIQELSKKKKK